MQESMSIRSEGDPDSERLKQGLKLLFIRPTSLVLGWLVCAFFAHGLFNVMAFWTIGWVLINCMVRPSKFGAEIGLAIDAVFQFLKACNAFMARHIAPIFAKANAAHHKARRANDAKAAPTPPAPMAFAAASRSAEASDAASAPAAPLPSTSIAAKPKTDWLAVFKRWWWIFPLVLIFLVVRPLMNIFDGRSGAEVAADARTNEAEARERTSNAEVDQREQATVRVETRYVTVERIVRETEIAREAIASAPDLDARIAVHRDFTQRMRDEAAASRAAVVSDYDSSVDP